ncbi:hypothetical protein PCASD_21083 [Puccinia coronata f. sp. avenae]|uniref:Integrase catalytic domain-containing protein n=1 Tax=Puccinia coronata f. sp. avenae TaxID=200324 RepID=A0A2N5TS90_9BASI|nr:hypothetical protein PCASD_21083 [Puccinia coronata f. sp. avenae]
MVLLSKSSTSILRVDGIVRVIIDHFICFDCSQQNNVLEIIGQIGPLPLSAAAFLSSSHSASTTPFHTWHHCLGHAGLARLKSALPDVKLVPPPSCDSCMKGKVLRIPFRGHFDRTDHPLQTVHADLVGPITPSTNSGCQYFLTLVDQHTGYISVTLLKKKSDAILDFRTFFEKQTGHNLLRLILDGGGKFCNQTLSDHLKQAGIQHNVSQPYTHQHNGVAERANKTIINMARCILSTISPLEQLFRKKTNYSIFRPFGCKAWIVKPDQNRTTKFDSIAWDGIFLGYNNDYSCYCIIKVESMSLVDVKHAWFDESVFPSLCAINPSHNLFPNSLLPDFSGVSALPFDSDNEDNHDHPKASLLPSIHPSNDKYVDIELPDDEETPSSSLPQQQPAGPHRLTLRLGPHRTQVSSSIDPSNILAQQTRSAVAFSALTVEPSNHFQAMSSDDHLQWKAAELKELDNMANHHVWDFIPCLPSHHTIPSTWAYRKKLGVNNEDVEFKARICAQGLCQTFGLNFES